MIKSRRKLSVLLLAAGAVALVGAVAVKASIPDGSGTIHGCYLKSAPPGSQPGALRVIDTSLGQACTVAEGAVNWSQTGPPGPQGIQGPQGPQGPTGPKGDPGANAYFAGTGLNLTGGNTFSIQNSYQLPQGCSTNQSPYLQNVFPTHPWGCFTAANANESCSTGKFQNGVNSSGDITCGTPSTGSGPDAWFVTYPATNTPQGSDTTVTSLSLPAGTFLLQAMGTAADDAGGNDQVDMSCQFSGGTAFQRLDAEDSNLPEVPFHVLDMETLAAPATVSLVCHDFGGSDGITGGTMAAIKIGTLH